MVSRIDNVLGVICYYLSVAFPACHFSTTQKALKAKRAGENTDNYTLRQELEYHIRQIQTKINSILKLLFRAVLIRISSVLR